jgi:hypothetical protein
MFKEYFTKILLNFYVYIKCRNTCNNIYIEGILSLNVQQKYNFLN